MIYYTNIQLHEKVGLFYNETQVVSNLLKSMYYSHLHPNRVQQFKQL